MKWAQHTAPTSKMSEGTIMTDAVVERTKTTMEAFERLIESPEAESRLELIDGEVVEKAMATQEHAAIVHKIGLYVGIYLLTHPIALAGPETRYRIPDEPRNSLIPDWSLVLTEDAMPVTRGAVPRMPDFAVEVMSPDDSIARMREKAAIYLRLGTRLVWLALPRQKVILSFWADKDRDEGVYTVEDTFDFLDLLPGFTIAIRDIFTF